MLNTSWAKKKIKIPISVIKRIIEYNHRFTIGTHAVIAHSAVLCSHYTFWHDTTAHNAACNYLFPEGGGLRKTAMSSSVPFIKRCSPLWQSLAQADSLGFHEELKQVHTRRGSSTAAIWFREQRPVKYSAHLHTTYCANLYYWTYSLIWVRYHTWLEAYYKLPGIIIIFLSDWIAIMLLSSQRNLFKPRLLSGLNMTLHPHNPTVNSQDYMTPVSFSSVRLKKLNKHNQHRR